MGTANSEISRDSRPPDEPPPSRRSPGQQPCADAGRTGSSPDSRNITATHFVKAACIDADFTILQRSPGRRQPVLRFTTDGRSPNRRISRFAHSTSVRWLDGNLPATIMPVAARKRQAGVAQLVEHHVANVVVEGSSPFTRSFLFPGRNMHGAIRFASSGTLRPATTVDAARR